MEVWAPLLYPGRTRLGWVALGAACGVSTLPLVWVALTLDVALAGRVISLGLALAYGWLADGALRLGLVSPPVVTMRDDGVTLRHGYLLGAPLEVPIEDVEAISVDVRPSNQQRVAAGVRRGGVAPPSFLDPCIPVVSALPSAHWDSGTAGAPNVVLWLRRPVRLRGAPRAARLLLALSGGRGGRFRGVRTGADVQRVRFTAADVSPIVHFAADRGLLVELDRDARYLSAVTATTRSRFRAQRLIMVAACAGAGLLVVVMSAL